MYSVSCVLVNDSSMLPCHIHAYRFPDAAAFGLPTTPVVRRSTPVLAQSPTLYVYEWFCFTVSSYDNSNALARKNYSEAALFILVNKF